MTSRIPVCALLALLSSAALVQPATGAIGREFQVTSQTYLGETPMTVSYNASSSAIVGTNLTVTAEVSVGNFTGSELYVRDYVLVVTLFSDDHSSNVSVGSPSPTQRYLYPGARWGPFNVSLPITAEDTGLSPGGDANASVTLSLITDVAYSAPGYGASGYTPVSGEGSTWVLITDPGPAASSTAPAPALGIPLLPSALVGGGIALLALRLAIFRKRP